MSYLVGPNSYCCTAETNRLVPKIRPGDKLTVDPDQEADNGDLVVVNFLLEGCGPWLAMLHSQSQSTIGLLRETNGSPVEIERQDILSIHPVILSTSQVKYKEFP